MFKITKRLKYILVRFLLFSGLFVIVSGIIGSWLVPTHLLYGFGFYLYGNLGKMVILSAVMFILLTKDRLKTMRIGEWSKLNLIYLITAGVLVPVFFALARELLTFTSFSVNIPLSLLTHTILITIPLLLLPGIFGVQFLVSFLKKFYKEIGICFILSIFFDVVIFQVWKLWPVFSSGVLSAVKFMLSLTFPQVQYISPLTLGVNNFWVSILQACSGLDSLFMFSALYAFIGLVDYKKLNMVKFFYLYPIAALGMYLVNILRVYFLIVIGATISPQLALRLFHTYAGMILFIIYFGLFWKVTYKKMLKN